MSPARKSTHSYSMNHIGNLALVFLLFVTGFSRHVDATRPKEQRGAGEIPYLVSPPGAWPDDNVRPPSRDLGDRAFTLRHVYHHGAHRYPALHRYRDVSKNAQLMFVDEFGETKVAPSGRLHARAMSTHVQRMADRRRSTIDNVLDYARIHGEAIPLPASAWTVDQISTPNHTDKATVVTFAKMAANAYIEEPWTGTWHNVKGGFNYTDDFGWQQDGLRGHIYVDETNRTIVIGLKGTSMAIFDGAETTGNDKLNDNLFGSCCCGQGGPYMWKKACDCIGDSAFSCNNTCLVKSLREKDHYYWAVKDLYHNVTERYPDADVWMAGHSLGGVVSTLLGLTFGLPVLTYEAFPDALAASRLGLPTPPGYRIGSHQSRPDVAIHHYGHTADPVFMGKCNGASSLCTIAGYAFEGHCHTGATCIYDTVGDLGWRVGVSYHSISSVIKDVLEKYDDVAICEEDTECTDCFNWKFFESNGTETTTTSSSTSTMTRTRTETCKTPGWWGCLDETSTSAVTTTTSTSSSSTSTCKTPGWFGCKDPTTIVTTTTTITSPSASPAPTLTTTSSIATSSSTCDTPGWFGCNDPTATPTSTPKPTSTTGTMSISSSSTSSCKTPGWLGCKDRTTTSSASKPSSTNLPTAKRKCIHRHWYGSCKEWGQDNIEPKNDL